MVLGAGADAFVFVDRGIEEGPGREGSGLELVRSTIPDPHLSSRNGAGTPDRGGVQLRRPVFTAPLQGG